MKKRIGIISTIIILSFFYASVEAAFITRPDKMIPLLFTLLGLSFIGYLFIYNPILELVRKCKVNDSNDKKKHLKKLISEFEESMFLIFILAIIIIIIDFIYYYNIPLIKNVYNLDLKIIYIYSLKDYIFKFIISICSGLSFYSLYDSISAILKMLRHGLEN